ncbi:MAG: hypothetical protein COA78_17210 [Blastopirellula sp.]|nr:MAG: hypothetical protein COA78_17210 [Blastopirellula sp.]
MTEIDQFESVFRAADKPRFHYKKWDIQSVCVVSDMPTEQLRLFSTQATNFLQACCDGQELDVKHLGADDCASIPQMLQKIEAGSPDIIVTYRNLFTPAADHPYSLGTHLDVMTQATRIPILVMPDPRVDSGNLSYSPPRNTMAVTDHLAGDEHLVNYAVSITPAGQTLWLTHVEDDVTLERYLTTISKIPQIDTETARTEITDQLLKEPKDYIRICKESLLESGADCTIEQEIVLGHHLSVYKRLIEQHAIELLVLNTKDEDQLAMHGQAYPLTIELRDTPILLL